MADVIVSRADILNILQKKTKLGENLALAKARFVSANCPYQIEQEIDIPESAWTHIGKRGIVHDVAISTDQKIWNWVIHGAVLKNDGEKSAHGFSFREEIIDEYES